MIPTGSEVVRWPVLAAVPIGGDELARARQYLYGGLAWGVAAQLWLLALLAFAFFSGASRAWAAWLRRRFSPSWTVAGVAVALFMFVLAGLLPFDLYRGYVREGWFGFQHQSLSAWLGQWTISAAVTTLVALIVIELVYAWLRTLRALRGPVPSGWWLRMWAVVVIAVVVAVAVDPLVIEPLFNRFSPVEDAGLRSEISNLAGRAGIPHARILTVNASKQSGHTNAYVVGLLGSQRIVLYDTLLKHQSPAEIAFVVGHEIGHYVLHHLWKGVGFTAALLLGLFALAGWLYPRWSGGLAPGDIAGLPLLLLLLVGLLYLAAPATNGFSRWEEHQADAYGLRLTPEPCAAVSSFVQEEKTDLIYPDPPRWVVWWFFTHPDQQQRIDFARQFCHSGPIHAKALRGDTRGPAPVKGRSGNMRTER